MLQSIFGKNISKKYFSRFLKKVLKKTIYVLQRSLLQGNTSAGFNLEIESDVNMSCPDIKRGDNDNITTM